VKPAVRKIAMTITELIYLFSIKLQETATSKLTTEPERKTKIKLLKLLLFTDINREIKTPTTRIERKVLSPRYTSSF